MARAGDLATGGGLATGAGARGGEATRGGSEATAGAGRRGSALPEPTGAGVRAVDGAGERDPPRLRKAPGARGAKTAGAAGDRALVGAARAAFVAPAGRTGSFGAVAGPAGLTTTRRAKPPMRFLRPLALRGGRRA